MRTLSARLALIAALVLSSQACHSRTPDAALPAAADPCGVSLTDADAAAVYKDRRLPEQRKTVIAMAACLRHEPRLPLNPETAVNILIFAGAQTEESEAGLPYFEAATDIAKQWTANEPNRAESHIALARAWVSYGEAKGIREWLGLSDPIKKELEAALAIDPAAQQGVAFILLGRIYHKVPPFFGGDNARAIEIYRSALATAPGSGAALLYFAEVLVEEGGELQNAEAGNLLEQLVTVAVDEEVPQETAEVLKQGGQLARRVGNLELSEKLKARSESIQ